jgi:hypothetical protein
MGLTTLFNDPYYLGGAVSGEVPGIYPVAIAGRPYLIDLKERYTTGLFTRATVPILRNSHDTTNLPGEQTLNPDDLWRRAAESWHLGAGQVHFDRLNESNPDRFRQSKGINPWTKWQVSLLADTGRKRTSANGNLYLAAAGSRLYLTDGTSLVFTADVTPTTPSFTTVTATPANAATAIATDGVNVWTAHGTNGLYSTTTSITTASLYTTGNVTLVRYAHGRLIVADNTGLIYNVTASGQTLGVAPLTALNALNTKPNFTWVDFTEGVGVIYGAGYLGDKSSIYRIGLRADASALDAPIVAGVLPDGELVRSLQGYLGFLLVGTDLGVRLCTQDGSGNLTVGPLIRSGPCRAMEPQDRFVWFGWENYDSNSTGLGRVDLSVFSAPMQPAYATDLMAGHPAHVSPELPTIQGNIGAVVSIYQGTPSADLRVFTVQGSGLFAPLTNLVPSGSIDSGVIMYGFPDSKIAMYFDIRHQALAGTVQALVNVDEAGFTTIGTNAVANSTGTTFPVGQFQGTKFEFRDILSRSSALTTGPTLIRNTLRAFPTPTRSERFQLPLMLHEDLNLGHGQRHIDPQVELDFLASLIHTHKIVTYQEQSRSFAVYLEDYEWRPHHPTRNGAFWNGLCVVSVKTIAE